MNAANLCGVALVLYPQLPITNMRTLDEVVSLETASRVVQLRVPGGVAAIALMLTAIGI